MELEWVLFLKILIKTKSKNDNKYHLKIKPVMPIKVEILPINLSVLYLQTSAFGLKLLTYNYVFTPKISDEPFLQSLRKMILLLNLTPIIMKFGTNYSNGYVYISIPPWRIFKWLYSFFRKEALVIHITLQGKRLEIWISYHLE